jgi:hypothetical protein
MPSSRVRTPGSSKWPPSLRFPHQNSVCTSPLPHTFYMPTPSQFSWLDHPNDVWWGVQSIKLFVILSSPLLLLLLLILLWWWWW